MSLHDSKVQKIEPLPPNEAKWTKLEKITYTDPLSTTRVWESASRTTRPANSLIDGVGIIAILQPTSTPLPPSANALAQTVQSSGRPHILLQKQFRPPVNGVCIEVPAGLVDASESATQAALRELKEETGYVGIVIEEGVQDGFGETPILWNDPGFCTTNTKMVHVRVELSDERNWNPETQLEENEFIECFAVELGGLYERVRELEREGYMIDARVGTFAEGVEVAKRWGLK